MRALTHAPILAVLACAPAAPREPAVPASAPAADDPAGPPRYKPSSSSPTAVPITTDAYGAYVTAESAPHLSDTLADFELPLADGGTFSLARARAAGPVVVMFYRGFW